MTEYVRALEATVREQTQAISALSSRVDATIERSNQPAARTPEDIEAEKLAYFGDPGGMTRNVVQDVVSRQLEVALKPLTEFVSVFKATSEYDNIKKRLATNPNFKAALSDPDILAAVDQVMSKQANPTEQMVQASILSAAGAKAIGLLPTVGTPNTQPTNQPANSTIYPPHMRPSGSETVNTQNNQPPKRRPLTENERTVMRLNGFKTEEEYWQWMEVPAGDVVVSEIGKVKPK